MALISMRQLLDHAAENGYGVPAFNVNNLEQTRAIMEAARRRPTPPVIMQASAGARKYAGAPFLRAYDGSCGHERVPAHPGGCAPGSRHLSPAVCQRSIQFGLQFSDDGRFTGWRTAKPPCQLRLQRGCHPSHRGNGPRLWCFSGGRVGLSRLPGNRRSGRGRRHRCRRVS